MPAELTVDKSRTASTGGDDLGGLVVAIEPVLPTTPCAEVYERFRGDPELIAIPVVEDGRAVGLVNRHDLTMSLAQDFGRALYAKKPISVKMDCHPLIVASTVQIEALECVIANEKPTALMRGFIVTSEGRYAGVGTALSLLQLSLLRTERRNRELEDARRAAESANRAKSHFLATMSHELRTPLNAVIGFSDLIQNEILGAISPPKYKEYARDINISALNLLAVINDILDMAKIEDGKMVLFEEAVNLGHMVKSAMHFVAARAHQNNIVLAEDVPADLPTLMADQRAIRHMLLNLLSNAVKFTPSGGNIIVRVRRVKDGGIELAVTDTGVGMSPEHIEIALTPFGQVANDYTRKHDGTGLGLPLVKSFAELHGAAFQIDSALGQGTSIRVTFPAERSIEASLALPEAAATAAE